MQAEIMRLLRINFYLLIRYHIFTFSLYCSFLKRKSEEWFKKVLLKTLTKSNVHYTSFESAYRNKYNKVRSVLFCQNVVDSGN